jgi:predicted RNase H-like HicB family nuclease
LKQRNLLQRIIFIHPDISSWRGETPEAALRELESARTAWLEAAKIEGKPIPAPSYRPLIYQQSG